MTTVCVMTSVHNAYDGRIYHKQCKSLAKAGYRVKLIAPKPSEREETAHIELIPFEKPKNRFKRLWNAFRIYKLARRTQADIFHFHDPDLLPVGLLLKLTAKKPVIYDVHEHYPNAIMGREYIPKPLRHVVRVGYEIVEKLALQRITGVIYTTSKIGKRYETYSSCKIENYPLQEMFSHRHQTKKDPKMFIYLGGMTKIRGVTELIEGFAQTVQKHRDAKLMFVGFFESDKYEAEIKQLVTDLKIEKNVIFQGKVPYNNINDYVAQASVGVLPYLPVPNHLVALPNKLLEYMAASNAVIASDFPHYREIVATSECGLLIDPRRPEEITKAMNFLLENQEETASMGDRAHEAFQRVYNWGREEAKLLHFYRKLLQSE